MLPCTSLTPWVQSPEPQKPDAANCVCNPSTPAVRWGRKRQENHWEAHRQAHLGRKGESNGNNQGDPGLPQWKEGTASWRCPLTPIYTPCTLACHTLTPGSAMHPHQHGGDSLPKAFQKVRKRTWKAQMLPRKTYWSSDDDCASCGKSRNLLQFFFLFTVDLAVSVDTRRIQAARAQLWWEHLPSTHEPLGSYPAVMNKHINKYLHLYRTIIYWKHILSIVYNNMKGI